MAKKDIIKRKKNEIIHDAKIDNDEGLLKNYKIVLATVIFILILFTILFL